MYKFVVHSNEIPCIKRWRLRMGHVAIIKLYCITSRRSNRIWKKRNDSPYIFGCVLHLRTRGTKHSRWIFFPRPKTQHTNKINAPRKRASTCGMQYHDKCHGIIHGGIIMRIIWKLPESDIHVNCPSRNGPLTTTNASGNRQHSGKIIVNGTAKQKLSWAIYMRFYRLQDIIRKNYFHTVWEEGGGNWRIRSQNTTQYGTTELWDQDIWNQQEKTEKNQKTVELEP